jgi:hypothetical protein
LTTRMRIGYRDIGLDEYYAKAYPYDLVYRMLTLDGSYSPQCRSLKFQTRREDHAWHDHFQRVNKVILKLHLKDTAPSIIHIGAFQPLQLDKSVYEHGISPAVVRCNIQEGHGLQNRSGARPEPMLIERREGYVHTTTPLREIVLDLDVNDMERFCSCVEDGVSRKRICHDCWLHLEGASLIITDQLQREMGIPAANILWVFSGGKGLHCIVNTTQFMRYNKQERQLLLALLDAKDDDSLILWIKHHATPSLTKRLHALFMVNALEKRPLLLLSTAFENYVLECLKRHYTAIYSVVKARWRGAGGPHERWALLSFYDTYIERNEANSPYHAVAPSTFILYRLFHPIIDSAPLVSLAHTSKAPFSVHIEKRTLALPTTLERIQCLKKDFVIRLDDYTHAQLLELPVFKEALQLFTDWISHYESLPTPVENL